MKAMILALLAAWLAGNDARTGVDPGAVADRFDRVLAPHVRDGSVDYAALRADRAPLDAIEEEKIFGTAPDGRIHFALVCAARGCPPLESLAYRARGLGEALDRRAREAIEDEAFVHIDRAARVIELPPIFRWSRDDFEEGGGSVPPFLARHASSDVGGDLRARLRGYDRSLNGIAGAARNVRRFASSTLLLPGETEVKLFHNVYTQTERFDGGGKKVDDGGRSTYHTATLSYLHGIGRRTNAGVDLVAKSVRDGRVSGGGGSRTAVTSIGPKLKSAPFRSLPRLALQATLRIPAGSDLDGSEGNDLFLDAGGFEGSLLAFYDAPLGARWLAYLEAGALFRFSGSADGLATPVKAVLHHDRGRRATIYALAEFAPEWTRGGRGDFYTQIGPGFKYALSPSFEVELLFTLFPAGKNKGAGRTYNLGMRLIR